MSSQRAIHALIKGRVQGVYYRASAEQQAKTLQLTGWIRNCPDGNVECVAQGNDKSLQAFIEWLWRGPEGAQVKAVDTHDLEIDESLQNFSVRYS